MLPACGSCAGMDVESVVCLSVLVWGEVTTVCLAKVLICGDEFADVMHSVSLSVSVSESLSYRLERAGGRSSVESEVVVSCWSP